jgi:hypothetical protein
VNPVLCLQSKDSGEKLSENFLNGKTGFDIIRVNHKRSQMALKLYEAGAVSFLAGGDKETT